MNNDEFIEKFMQSVVPCLITEFQPERVILFGSRVTGDAIEESDIDVIIVSKKFDGVPFLKRMPIILKKIGFPKHIDFICYTPEELESIGKKSSLILDALKNGIEVKLQ